jgi:DNA-directed RNA polymerase subunit RPC12/RpoP
MAGSLIVVCPECEKKFKPKSDVSGKKIKCPFCAHAFVVPAAKEANEDEAKPDTNKSEKAKPREADVAPVLDAAPPPDEDGIDPYGIKNVELVPRCPNCTQEMGEHEIICLACGYNTMTRQWGKTEKTIGVTTKRQLIYLLPAIGSFIFTFFMIIVLLIYDTIVPYWVADSWASFIDSEAMRMWITLIFLGIFWTAGMFCFYKFIEKPMPDEIQLD